VRTDEEALAYVATRLPATYAAAQAAMRHVAELWPAYAPSSQLDLGAGPGAAAWAAAKVWPSVETVELRDRDEPMMRLGAELAAGDFRWTWQRADMTGVLGNADLVTICYALGELEPAAADAVASAAWQATNGCLVLVEAGTPSGFGLIGRLRRRLIEEGGHLVAPCPDDGTCPIAGADWCHFAARVGRSALHRSLKGAERSFEDEKFSYVAFARGEPARAAGRVVRRPVARRRYLELSVCADGVIRQAGIGQTQACYRAACKLGWGDGVPPDVLGLVRTAAPQDPGRST
jgi:ribosomal protein RSM22 (predicted rRNA methylase)